MQRKLEPLNNKKPNVNIAIAEKALKRQAYLKAIEHFDKAIKVEPDNGYLFLQKGRAYLGLKRYASAIMAFEQAEILESTLKPIISLEKQNVLKLSQDISQDMFIKINTPVEEILRADICLKVYQEELIELCQKHKNIKTLNYLEQINWSIRLMEFSFKYYDRKNVPMLFVNSEFFDNSETGRVKRFKKLESQLNYILGGLEAPYLKSVDKQALDVFEHLQDDIFLGDSMLVLRMIFETIHQFSRKQRADLLEHLPWGTNSWYFLEFCSTFFQSNSDKRPICFVRPPRQLDINGNIVIDNFSHFYNALQNGPCLVKAVIPALFEDDIPQLHRFFVSVRDSFTNPGTPISKLGGMDNLKTLLWYFKHTYQLVRLTALAPKQSDTRLIFESLNNHQNIELTPLMNLYMLDSPMDSLKSKLAFIRRIQLIGEIFTPRNWGNQLKNLKVIDTEMLSDIRNALCHPEDLGSVDFIHDLESNKERLLALYTDFAKLRTNIYDLITERQNNFTLWPNTSTPFKAWSAPVCTYWDSVKKYYHPAPSFNPDIYTPNQLLITKEQLELFEKGVNLNLSESKTLYSMIKGELVFDMPNRAKFRGYLNAGQKEGPIYKIVQIAFKDYKERKSKAAKATTGDHSLQKEAKKSEIIQFTTANFPNMRELGSKAHLILHRDVAKQMDMIDLLNLLKSRMTLLKLLFLDAKIDFNIEESECVSSIQSVICKDIEVQLACSYLTAQIVSIFSKLEKGKLLNALDPHLISRMSQFKSLRNALEHSDPVIDSKDTGFIHMKSKVILLMGVVSYELLVIFFESIMSAKASELKEHEQFGDENTDSMALNVSGLIYPSSPRLNITNYNQFLFFASQDDSSDRSAVSIEKVSQDSSENDSKEDLKCSQH
jgi:tetratricopeptide (TPR) repeat protein